MTDRPTPLGTTPEPRVRMDGIEREFFWLQRELGAGWRTRNAISYACLINWRLNPVGRRIGWLEMQGLSPIIPPEVLFAD